MSLPSELLEIARRAADAAAAELLPRFGGPASGVAAKSSSTDLVSDADRAAEAAIRRVLGDARPDDALLAEEGGSAEGTTGVRWIVDPLDGTTNYLWGIPHWAVSIAAVGPDGGLAAVVLDPCSGECFAAGRGLGAWLGDRPMRVTRPAALDQALVGTGFNYSAEERGRQSQVLTGVMTRVRDIRRFGAAALDLAWTAAGRLDAFFERGLERWDWAAGALLVTEAGGAVQVIDAAPPRPGGVVAAHPDLVDEVRRLFEDPV
ncbi:MAG: inositol monophosphatase family protein [Thermoleophilia bacterium]